MIRTFFAAALLTLFASPAPAIDAYVVAGQSNGWRLSTLAGGPTANPDGATIHYFGMQCVSEPESSKLQTLAGLTPNRMGFGLATGLLTSSGGEDIVFIQYCRCGAPVLPQTTTSWFAGDDPQNGETFEGGLFPKFEKYIENVRAQVREATGEELEFKGVLWHQGESDAGSDKAAYQVALRNVFWRIRDLLGEPALPIVAGHIRDLGEDSAGINTVLDQIATSDKNIASVAHPDGLDYEPDSRGKPNVHIATAGCHELGLAMAGAMAALTPAGAEADPDVVEPFHAYLPSRTTGTILVIKATPTPEGLTLEQLDRHAIGLPGGSIAAHPDLPVLYVSHPGGPEAAFVRLRPNGSIARSRDRAFPHGYSYLSLDRSKRFLLGCNYKEGFVDVIALIEESGLPGRRVGGLDEGRPAAHCILPSPDNRFVYIPYVKDSNGLFQYAFDAETGALSPLDPKEVEVPEPSGPRHLAYHPTLPILYTSNEQRPGISAYQIAENGQLSLDHLVEALGDDAPEEGVSSSDIVVTPDGRHLFSGIRAKSDDIDAVARYSIAEDGIVTHLGNTPADDIPWGFALSPDARHLLVTAAGGGTLTAFEIGEDGSLTEAAKLEVDERITDIVTR